MPPIVELKIASTMISASQATDPERPVQPAALKGKTDILAQFSGPLLRQAVRIRPHTCPLSCLWNLYSER